MTNRTCPGVLLFLLVSAALAACGGPLPAPAPTPTSPQMPLPAPSLTLVEFYSPL